MSVLIQKENSMLLISVIVPVYNGQDYLEKCVKSIENQTYKNIEVIIVNDGSTDDTGEICDRLKEEYDNVHVITMDDEGVSAARNAGVDVAKGDFITFVDADDRIMPDMLEVLYNGIVDTQSDICGCSFMIWKKEEQWQELLNTHRTVNSIKTYQGEDYLVKEILNGNSRCWSKLYKRDAIGKQRFQKNLTIGEDMLFLVDIIPSADKITELSFEGYGYYQNPNGAMNRTFTPRYMDQITCWELARKKMPDKEVIQSKVTSILIVSILLTVSKLALLSEIERKKYKEYVDVCRNKLKKELQVKGAFAGLSRGYKFKATLFKWFPSLYLMLYHFRKYKV